MCEFEAKVKKNLEDIMGAEIAPDAAFRIGAAVSGGADSVALLLALSEILNSKSGGPAPLYVITVNHNIRPAAESRGDVDFVLELCEKLRRDGREIVCDVVELEKGEVARMAEGRGGGTEEAARYLRYAAFGEFAAERGLSALCLAHNRNDQLETLLMRFLQGSPAEAAAGIRARRELALPDGKASLLFARPLLDISRAEIEAYVTSRGYTWRTDKTNLETDYLRNRIRLKLLPFLDEEFPGWQKAVLSGGEKAAEDAQIISSYIEKIPLLPASDGSFEIPYEAFIKAPAAIQRRLLLSACNKAGEEARIPSLFIKDVLDSLSHSEGFSKHFAGIEILLKKKHLFVKKYSESNTDLCFSAIIEKTGTFEFPFGILDVYNYKEQAGKQFVSVCAGEVSVAEGISLPFCVRNPQPGDTVLCADGSEKKVSDILSDWHVAPEKRCLLPVIQLLDEKAQRIKAILAGFLGYKDWIVKL